MTDTVFWGLMIPFIGTALGAACVLFLKKEINAVLQHALIGFAAGVMVAASVWSLLLPSIDRAADMGKLAFFPAVSGFCVGIVSMMLADKLLPHIQAQKENEKVAMLVLAVVIHNIPEGMAVGAAFAGALAGQSDTAFSAAMMLSTGIGIQNLPEGAIISMPLASRGMRKGKAFGRGVLSGIVEPIAGALTVLLSTLIVPILPYLLAFAAGAMIYVVVEELVPEMSECGRAYTGTLMFMLGFSLMMTLDVALG